jgi:hypothetical protein
MLCEMFGASRELLIGQTFQARYPFPDLNTLPDDIKAKHPGGAGESRLHPNVFLAFARRPAEWRAFFAYHDALMVPESRAHQRPDQGRARDDRHHHQRGQPLPVLRGGARCHPAHLREKTAGGRPGGRQLPQGRHHAAPARHAGLRDEGLPAVRRTGRCRLCALHAHGFDDEDIWDIAAITAFFGLSNRMASFSGMLPNPEFYLMGRVPKQK